MKRFIIFIISIFIYFSSTAQSDSLLQNWTFGAKKGLVSIGGDIDSKSGFAFGFFSEKHLNKIFSARLYLGMGKMQGQDLESTTDWTSHPVWNGKINAAINYNNASTNVVFPNFETNYMETSVQGIFTFSQLPGFNNKSSFDGFLLAGIGAMRYETLVDAADANGDIYDFSVLEAMDSKNETRFLTNLNSFFDGKFETAVQENPEIAPLYQVGGGIKWKIKNNIEIVLTHRVSFLGTDELDSYQLDESNDIQHFTTLGLNYTIFKKKKKEPIFTPPVPFLQMVKIELPIVPVTPEIKTEILLADFEWKKEAPEKVELTKEEEKVIKKAFDNLEFETGKAIIRAGSLSSLDELATLLSKQPNWKLRIEGHTDNVGDDVKNLELSKNRAEAVRNYLVSKGISTNRFIVSWYGEERPIADNETNEGRQKNRRVEMEIVE